jgi:selenocysteine lyase/cysteine desulfurase
MQAYLTELVDFGASKYPISAFSEIADTRKLGADLMGCDADNVFFVRSTSQGLGIAATGIPFKPGDNLVLVEDEFPANLRPWMPLRRKDIDVRLVPQPEGRVLIDDLAAAMDEKTAALSISFVQYLSGFRIDLAAVAELCRKHDALFIVDAIQGLGAFPLNVEASGVDFLSADSHKWLLGPEGIGLGYASQRALERIEQCLEGWLAVENPFDFCDLDQPLKCSAARYEEGAFNMAGIHGLKGSLELLLGTGIDNLAARILKLTDYLTEGLKSRGWTVDSPRQVEAEKSGIILTSKEGVNFGILATELMSKNISISIRGGGMRISPHGYNNTEDLDRLLEALG